jgi:hypothetical protein
MYFQMFTFNVTVKITIEILKTVTFRFSRALAHPFAKNQGKLHMTILFGKKIPHDLHKLQAKFSIFLLKFGC